MEYEFKAIGLLKDAIHLLKGSDISEHTTSKFIIDVEDYLHNITSSDAYKNALVKELLLVKIQESVSKDKESRVAKAYYNNPHFYYFYNILRQRESTIENILEYILNLHENIMLKGK